MGEILELDKECDSVYASHVLIQPYIVVAISAILFRLLQVFLQQYVFPCLFPDLVVRPTPWKTKIDWKKREIKVKIQEAENKEFIPEVGENVIKEEGKGEKEFVTFNLPTINNRMSKEVSSHGTDGSVVDRRSVGRDGGDFAMFSMPSLGKSKGDRGSKAISTTGSGAGSTSAALEALTEDDRSGLGLHLASFHIERGKSEGEDDPDDGSPESLFISTTDEDEISPEEGEEQDRREDDGPSQRELAIQYLNDTSGQTSASVSHSHIKVDRDGERDSDKRGSNGSGRETGSGRDSVRRFPSVHPGERRSYEREIDDRDREKEREKAAMPISSKKQPFTSRPYTPLVIEDANYNENLPVETVVPVSTHPHVTNTHTAALRYNPYIPLFVYWQALVALFSFGSALYLVIHDRRETESGRNSHATLSSHIWDGYQDFYGILVQSPALTSFTVLCIEVLSGDHIHKDTHVYRLAILGPPLLFFPMCVTHIIPGIVLYCWVWILAGIGFILISLVVVFCLYIFVAGCGLGGGQSRDSYSNNHRSSSGYRVKSTVGSRSSSAMMMEDSDDDDDSDDGEIPSTSHRIVYGGDIEMQINHHHTLHQATRTKKNKKLKRKEREGESVYALGDRNRDSYDKPPPNRVKGKLFDIAAGIFLRIFIILLIQTIYNYMYFYYRDIRSNGDGKADDGMYLEVIRHEFQLRLQSDCHVGMSVFSLNNFLVFFNWV